MQKRKLLYLLSTAIILLLTLGGCVAEMAESTGNGAAAPALSAEQPSPEPAFDLSHSGEMPAAGAARDLQPYLQTYSPLSVYQDCLIGYRYLLLSDDRIVTLFLAEGFSECVVLDGCDVVSVEAETVGGMAFLRITDKAGTTHYLTLEAAQADQAMRELTAITGESGA